MLSISAPKVHTKDKTNSQPENKLIVENLIIWASMWSYNPHHNQAGGHSYYPNLNNHCYPHQLRPDLLSAKNTNITGPHGALTSNFFVQNAIIDAAELNPTKTSLF